jgi:tripartite-type tricarboxylate transporter receptor subunit TctC
MKRRQILVAAVALFATGAPGLGTASSVFPAKPIRIVLPYAPGGATDLLGRAVAQQLQQSLGQPITIENKPGAATMIGSELVARAAPDGYTLLLATTAVGNNTVLYKKVPYQLSNFTAVAPLAVTPNVLAVNASIPATDLQSFVRYAKSVPGKLNYAAIGTGGLSHLATERFKSTTGLDLVEVNFPGSAQGQTALAGNHVQVFFDSIPTALPLVRAGSTRILAITSEKRSSLLPDVPTFAELGMPELTKGGWYGFLAPAGTPGPVLERLRAAIEAAVRAPDVLERLTALGAEPLVLTSADFDQYIREDVAYWGDVARKLGVALEN